LQGNPGASWPGAYTHRPVCVRRAWGASTQFRGNKLGCTARRFPPPAGEESPRRRTYRPGIGRCGTRRPPKESLSMTATVPDSGGEESPRGENLDHGLGDGRDDSNRSRDGSLSGRGGIAPSENLPAPRPDPGDGRHIPFLRGPEKPENRSRDGSLSGRKDGPRRRSWAAHDARSIQSADTRDRSRFRPREIPSSENLNAPPIFWGLTFLTIRPHGHGRHEAVF
jgi:hypothetical protein